MNKTAMKKTALKLLVPLALLSGASMAHAAPGVNLTIDLGGPLLRGLFIGHRAAPPVVVHRAPARRFSRVSRVNRMRDNDRDGVPNRHDSRPNNPRRW